MAKSIHEAKLHSSWRNPDPEYDEAIDRFTQAVLDREGNQEFLDDFLSFQRFVSHHGMINSLAQTLLKIAAPGVPDTYQGTELWDFSLVDPDNRRPVDYDRRSSMLKDLISRRGDPGQLVRELVAAPRTAESSSISSGKHWPRDDRIPVSSRPESTGHYEAVANTRPASSRSSAWRVRGRRLSPCPG